MPISNRIKKSNRLSDYVSGWIFDLSSLIPISGDYLIIKDIKKDYNSTPKQIAFATAIISAKYTLLSIPAYALYLGFTIPQKIGEEIGTLGEHAFRTFHQSIGN